MCDAGPLFIWALFGGADWPAAAQINEKTLTEIKSLHAREQLEKAQVALRDDRAQILK